MLDFTSAQAKQQLIKYEQAIPIFQPLAENGDEKAQYFLGVSYWYIAYLTPQITKEEIVQWTEKAMDQFEKAYNQHGSLAGVAAYGIAKCYLCWFEQVWNPIRPYFDSFCKRKIKKRSSYQKKYQEDKKLAEDLCGHLWHWARLAAELDHQKGKNYWGNCGAVYISLEKTCAMRWNGMIHCMKHPRPKKIRTTTSFYGGTTIRNIKNSRNEPN